MTVIDHRHTITPITKVIIEEKLYVVALTPDQAKVLIQFVNDSIVSQKRGGGNGLGSMSYLRLLKSMRDQFDPHIACGGAEYVVAEGERRMEKYAAKIAKKALGLK